MDIVVDEEPATNSWVHLSFFNRWEAMSHCHPWTTVDQLRRLAAKMPGSERPQWETEFEIEDFLPD
jgi:hypothetical protein